MADKCVQSTGSLWVVIQDDIHSDDESSVGGLEDELETLGKCGYVVLDV